MPDLRRAHPRGKPRTTHLRITNHIGGETLSKNQQIKKMEDILQKLKTDPDYAQQLQKEFQIFEENYDKEANHETNQRNKSTNPNRD